MTKLHQHRRCGYQSVAIRLPTSSLQENRRIESRDRCTRGQDLSSQHEAPARPITSARLLVRLLAVVSPERRLLLEVALTTGLRANELRELRVRHLDRNESGLRLDTAWTKNRKDGFQPLPQRLLKRLLEHSEGKEPDEPLLHVSSHPASNAPDVRRNPPSSATVPPRVLRRTRYVYVRAPAAGPETPGSMGTTSDPIDHSLFFIDADSTGVLQLWPHSLDESQPLFHRGDPNASGTTDSADALAILGYLFLGEPEALSCLESSRRQQRLLDRRCGRNRRPVLALHRRPRTCVTRAAAGTLRGRHGCTGISGRPRLPSLPAVRMSSHRPRARLSR